MSWEHQTVGFEAFEAFLGALDIAGIAYAVEFKDEVHTRGQDLECGSCGGYCDWEPEADAHTGQRCECCMATCGHRQNLRLARFTDTDGNAIVEEYLRVKDYDCDGTDIVDIAVYPEGQRPELRTTELAA